MLDIQETVIIRNRGQITIPEKIRKGLGWPKTNVVMSMAVNADSEIVMKPYSGSSGVDWSQLWQDLKKSRAYKGVKGNLAEFIILDRERH